MSTKGILANLLAQFERVYKHSRQTGIGTKRRYREAMIRFLAFLAEVFRLEKIRKNAPKHIYDYVAYMIEKGSKIGYVKTELAALRFWYGQIPNTKYQLPSGVLTIKGKDGLQRQVPINLSIEIELQKMLDITPRGRKLFVAPGDKTHLAMLRLESFLYDHKEEIQDPGSTRPLSFHGLCHSFAVEQYRDFVSRGLTEKEARLAVAKLLGYGRDSVTRVYLASIDDADSYGTNTPT